MCRILLAGPVGPTAILLLELFSKFCGFESFTIRYGWVFTGKGLGPKI